MSAATAIGMVSESLRTLLSEEFKLSENVSGDVHVTVLGPDETTSETPRINLFLYRVQENPSLKNLDWRVKPGEPGRLLPPPLSLNLFYLMTAYATNDTLVGNATAHAILGDAMRIFYENPVVPDAYLADGLKDAPERIKIMLNPLNMEELSTVWHTFSQPFRLSVLYEISVVQLDMLSSRERDMAVRARIIGVPKLEAPYAPPSLTSLSPASGQAGGTVTLSGSNLSGWKAYVRIGGKMVVDGQAISGDAFSFALPGDLLPGFQEIRVDISHLHRRTFFFEVLP
jgi:hypothetical protein